MLHTVLQSGTELLTRTAEPRFQACAYILKTMLAKREKELAIFCPALMVAYNYMSMDAA